MKIAFSVPSGYHLRELLLPLKSLLEQDEEIEKIICITPGALWRKEIFPTYGEKFEFVANPKEDKGHNNLLTKIAPDIVVTNTSGLDAKDTPILSAAKKQGFRTLTFIASWDNVWKMERLANQQAPQVIADHLIVWNAMMQDHLLRVFPAISPEQISIIGAPRLDFFSHRNKIPSREQLLSYLDLPHDDSKLIHVATTELYPLDYVIKTLHTAEQAHSLPHKLHFYASVHPGGNMERHKPYAEKYQVAVRYSFGRRVSSPHPDFLYNPTLDEIYMLVALFKHTDVLVNHSSTVALESFLADRPVINVKYGKPLDWWRWYRSMVYRDFQQHYRDITADGATTIVTNPRQLIAAVSNYLEHPELHREARQKTLKKLITNTDGTASEQALNLIKKRAHG
jgi:hypothetical protein